MKTADLEQGAIYAHSDTKYNLPHPVVVLDVRRFETSSTPYRVRSDTRLSLVRAKPAYRSPGPKGPLCLMLNSRFSPLDARINFYEWDRPSKEHPRVIQLLADIAPFREQVNAITDTQNFSHEEWPSDVQVVRPQTLLGLWDAVRRERAEQQARNDESMEVARQRDAAREKEFLAASALLGDLGAATMLSQGKSTVSMPLGHYIAIANALKGNKS